MVQSTQTQPLINAYNKSLEQEWILAHKGDPDNTPLYMSLSDLVLRSPGEIIAETLIL